MICVLIPVHNGEDYIAACLRSVLAQQVPIALSVIIVDDGSTDRTLAQIESLCSPLISVTSTAWQGVAAARNALLRLVPPEADYVTFIDADDLMPQGKLARDLAPMAKDTDLGFVYGRMAFFETSGSAQNEEPTPFSTVRSANLAAGTYRADILLANGPFDESFEHGEDLDFLFRLFETSRKHLLHDEISVFYRQHDTNMTKRKDALRRGIMKAMLRHAQRRRADPSRASAEGVFDSRPRKDDAR
ncbi:glycosyltransferase family A protein [Yoonia sp.]|uniref:glycosyltransferase family A protein n=1 Tax=Yoonia sp. TaxID=2212373 RepID=UPI002FD9DF1F